MRTPTAREGRANAVLGSAFVPQRPVRTVAAVSRHPRRFPDPITAVGELIRVLGDVDPFLTIDREGRWIDACTDVPEDFAPTGWIERRVLAAGDWRVGKADGMRAEQLVEREDGRPSWLVSIDELPIGENEAEPGGESFGLTTLIARSAGLRRIGVNLDVVHPGQRSARFHWHRSEEEGFLVLAGTGWLYAGDERFRVGAGDFFAKPEGPKLAHQFVNDGDSELRILSIGEHREDDAVEYPTPPWEPGGRAQGE
jgi:uncharacterized cupin superfamily protein